jgi:hypothetical protein
MKNLTELSYKKKVDEILERIYREIEGEAKESKNELWTYIPCMYSDKIEEKDIEKIILILKGDGFRVGYPAGWRNFEAEVSLVIRW